MLGDLHNKGAQEKSFADSCHHPAYNQHRQIFRTAFKRGAESEDDGSDHDALRSANRIRQMASPERGNGGGDEDGGDDKTVDGRSERAEGVGEGRHGRDRANDAGVEAEEEAANGDDGGGGHVVGWFFHLQDEEILGDCRSA